MKRRLPLQRRWRLPLVALSLALGMSGSVAHSGESAQHLAFSEHFAAYDVAPRAFDRADGAVDLAQIDPPVESSAPVASQALGEGTASYYGRRFNGSRTASGETFDMRAFTAAHRTLPFGSKVRVTNLENDRSVVVRINDRGPFSRKRLIDLSRAAAEEIGLVERGHGTVRLELVED